MRLLQVIQKFRFSVFLQPRRISDSHFPSTASWLNLRGTLWRGMRRQVAPGWARNAPSSILYQDGMITPIRQGAGSELGQFFGRSGVDAGRQVVG
jgi:hypothetical protein